MPNELTNLLPPERVRSLARDYLLRMSVVVAVLVTILTLTATVLLVPTYVLLEDSAQAKKVRLASVEATFSSADEIAFSARLAALAKNAEKLAELSRAPSVGATMRDLLATGRAGIALSGFAYTPATDKSPRTVAVSGMAETRDALRNFQLALQKAPFARSATVPVSAYASDTDIAFTVTITLAP